MARPVYSTQFSAGEVNASFLTYVVPAGFVAVLKSLYVCTLASAGTWQAGLALVGGGAAQIDVVTFTSAFAVTSILPSIVLNPGDELVLYSTVSTSFIASGYLLSA